MNEREKSVWPVSKKILLVSLVFGMAALLVMSAGLIIPVIGTSVRLDPRELFVTIGSALTGPVGGIIIGFMALDWFGDIGADRLASLFAHIIGGLWMGVSYKKLVFQRLKMPWLLLGWAILLFVYYFLILAGSFITLFYIFSPTDFGQIFGEASIWQVYWLIVPSAVPEFAITLIITAIILGILPAKYRRPLW